MRTTTIAAAACLLLLTMTAASAANYSVFLNGQNESPSNNSPGVGAAIVSFDASSHILQVNVAFGSLMGDSSAAHIHCCTPTAGTGTGGVATETPTFGGFPLGVHAGGYSNTYDTTLLASWNSAFVTANGGTAAGAEAAFAAGLNSGKAYLNIHSSLYPAGEIRGFLTPIAAVPEPSSIAMLGLGLPAVLLMARRRRA
ncbi:CHRD domain-containing protein [Duganella aceris]|uniref:CHRD domain-containing protein n=1 Tax=Duganella aceris TaxID=2703883 RepID=A0ABX0FM80_9BURK|nr:CHRD domain-containing protein [Duganella aceris]NGZ85640.1 CHRD domain-containing protein [Duganella aceris]